MRVTVRDRIHVTTSSIGVSLSPSSGQGTTCVVNAVFKRTPSYSLVCPDPFKCRGSWTRTQGVTSDQREYRSKAGPYVSKKSPSSSADGILSYLAGCTHHTHVMMGRVARMQQSHAP